MDNPKPKTPRRGRPPRSQKAIDASRERIVAAARDLFAAEGYDGVSMRKIAARAGCLPATLYTLFPGKRQLLHCLWGQIFSDLNTALARSCQESAPHDGLLRLCFAHIDFWLDRPQDYRAIFLVEDRLQDSGDPYFVESEVAARYLDILHGAIVQAQASGEIGAGNPDEVRKVLLCCIQGLTYNLIAIPEFDWGDIQRLKTLTITTVLLGLR